MIDDETLHMYVDEAREHLEDIEANLLEVEQAGDDFDSDQVNKVFRAAHSMKGGAGFLGLTNIKELAHKIENVLDMVRNYELSPTPDIVNIVLLAFDRLSELVDKVTESNEMEIDEHIQALTAVTSNNLPNDEKDSVSREVEIADKTGRNVMTISELDFNQARKGGNYIYLLEFDLIHDVQRKDKKPLDLIKEMQSTGNIMEVKVDLQSVGSLDDEPSNILPMYMLFSTIIEPDIITTFLDMEQERVLPIEDKSAEKEAVSEEKSGAGQGQSSESIDESIDKSDSAPDLPPSESNAGKVEPESEKVPEKKNGPGETVSKEISKPEKPVKGKSKKAAKEKAGESSGASAVQSESLRVQVSLLENLMNLAGELVLSRNQLMQSVSVKDNRAVESSAQRIDLVTSELQEAIMLTRMQPVGNVFNKFPRVVRDIAREMDKEIELKMEGKEVELDKTILEGLSDPLTHLVRNSADHGIEPPEERREAGKKTTGVITLKAYHAAGQVNIAIVDDGKGMDGDKIAAKALEKGLISDEQMKNMSEMDKLQLIFMPGLSTAEQVSDVSGRGVGMDVVKSNLDRLGGQVEIDTALGRGTSILIKLPLTLAIIPSLLVSMGEDRFAVPQVNVVELIQIPAEKVAEKVEKVGEAEVLVLRGELIPLMALKSVLGMKKRPEGSKAAAQDRNKTDEQDIEAYESRDTGEIDSQDEAEEYAGANSLDTGKDLSIVIVSAGSFKYGLVVDTLHDTVEIVVKPLGRHLKSCEGYAGATIMGDGKVALILDIVGLARLAKLSTVAALEREDEADEEEEARKEEVHSLFLFNNAPGEYCAVPLSLVSRVEMIQADQIEEVGGKKVIQYRGGSLPVFALEEVADVGHLEPEGEVVIIVFVMADHEVGLLAFPPVDAVEVGVNIDDFTLKQTGIAGSMIVNKKTTLMIDIFEFMEALNPHWFEDRRVPEVNKSLAGKSGNKILLVEDSDFFRGQVKKFIEEDGYAVVVAADGVEAWEYLTGNPKEIGLVVTDLEMPNMDGFELTEHIRGDERFADLPVLALTSLAGEDDVARGEQVGIDDYQIKLDKDKLLKSIVSFVKNKAA
ncbi:MAG: chemotaxis protein CheW [Thermodesulfobacteriota bacterium]